MAASLKQRVFVGTLWMSATSFGRQVLAFVAQIVLARLLVPKDYGVVAIVMSIGSFAVVFSTVGISTALVQRKELPKDVVDAAAVITGGLAILLGGTIFVSSRVISSFYKLPEMTFLIRLVALDVFLKVMGSLYDSLMLRDLRYRALSIRTFASLVIQSGTSIALAACGYGAKSLVFGYLLGSASFLILSVIATRYVPCSLGDFSAVRDVFRFGFWILLGRMANQAAVSFDQMLIAKVLNPATLGLINVSKSLTGLVPGTIAGISGRVTFPVFSRWQDDIRRIESAYWRCLRLNVLLVFPICSLMGLFSYQFLALIYGTKWLGGHLLMKIFAVQISFMAIDAGYSVSVLNAIGKPKYGCIVRVVSLFIIPGFVYIGSFWGMNGVAWAMVAYEAFFFVLNQLLLHYLCQFRISNSLRILTRALLTLMPMVFVAVLLAKCGVLPHDTPPQALSKDWFLLGFRIMGCAVICLSTYCLTAYAFMRDDTLFLLRGIWGALTRN